MSRFPYRLNLNIDFSSIERIKDGEPDENQEKREDEGSDSVPRPGNEKRLVEERFQSQALAAGRDFDDVQQLGH